MKHISWLTPFLALLVTSLPIISLNYPDGHDWLFELVRTSEYMTALENGQSPPYWGENLYGGYGSPIFLFYAPLYLLVSSVASLLAGSIAKGSSLATLLFTLVAVITMFYLVRGVLETKSFANSAAARVAASIFVLNPYLICDKFLRNANAEYAALCLAPLPLYGLIIIQKRPTFGSLILSAGFALVILAHNLTALVVAAFLTLFAAVLYLPSRDVKLFGRVAGSLGLGLGLSVFFWLPALKYKSLVEIGQITIGKFDFHNQFKPLAAFFGYDRFFSTGLLVPAALAVALLVLWFAGNAGESRFKRLIYVLLASSFFVIFLQMRSSTPIWENAPFLPLFQFPWRMMGPLALFSSLLVGLSFAWFAGKKSPKVIAAAEMALLALAVLNAYPHLNSTKLLEKDVRVQLPALLKGESIKTKGMPATVLDEYLPKGASARAWLGRGPVVRSDTGMEIKVVEKTGTTIIFEAEGDGPGRVDAARWAFPEWRGTVNGEPLEVKKNERGGVFVDLPAGKKRVTLTLLPPPLRRVTLLISMGCLFLWSALLVVGILKRCRCTISAGNSE